MLLERFREMVKLDPDIKAPGAKRIPSPVAAE
jgi:hypothetical protein